jgi:hypothetical protein
MRASALAIAALTFLSAVAIASDFAGTSRRAPLWKVSGRWEGANGAEYVVFRQRKRGVLDITIHHTCAPGHVERGTGRISGDRVTGRVTPVSAPPPGCVRFATIDVRVNPSGTRMSGTYETDLGAGELVYLARRQARSLVRFRPRIERRSRRGGGYELLVRLRPRPGLPSEARARVRLCRLDLCVVRYGRYALSFGRPRKRCGRFIARVSFAGSIATTHRRLCA